MKRVEKSELLGLGPYEEVRESFRKRIIEDKRQRRFIVCDEVSVVFENHDTVLYQIQEMLRTERITRETAIQHEIDTYNELVPGEGELSATMFVEISDGDVRDRRLVELAGLEERIGLEIDGRLVRARNETRGVLPDRTTAVHYIKFALGTSAERVRALGKDGTGKIIFVIDHPKLQVRTDIPSAVMRSLAEDLASDA